MLRPYHDPRPRLRRGTPQEPRAPAAPYTWQTRVGLAGLGAPKAPPLCCGRPPTGCPDGAKSAVGMCGPRVSWTGLPVGHTPLERQRFRGMWATWPADGPLRKLYCGPSKSYERPGKRVFRHEIENLRPGRTKGIRGADTRPTSWSAWSAQPTALTSRVAALRSSSPLPSVGALTAGGTGRPGYRRSCCSHPCPHSARVPITRTPVASFRGGGAAACPCPLKRKSGARLPPGHLPVDMESSTRPRTGWRPCDGAPIRYAGEITHEAAGWLPTAEGT